MRRRAVNPTVWTPGGASRSWLTLSTYVGVVLVNKAGVVRMWEFVRKQIAFLREQVEYLGEQPVERLLKPSIRTVVIVGALTVAAHVTTKRPLDRQSLARLATGQSVVKEPAKTGSIRRSQ